MTLAEARAALAAGQRRVCYRAGHPGAPREYGSIASVNDYWVFVRYDGDNGAKATDAAQLQPAPDGGVRRGQ